MVSTEPVPVGARPPMTRERALTAVTQARAAVVRAHREMAEALEIMAGPADPAWPLGESTKQRAARLLHLTSVMAQLDRMRAELLIGGNGEQRRSPRAAADRPSRQAAQPSEPIFEGEYPPIEERLVVSPGWGHLHRRRLREGRRVERDAVIGELRSARGKVAIRAPVSATFSSWLVPEGAMVAEGWALARLQLAED